MKMHKILWLVLLNISVFFVLPSCKPSKNASSLPMAEVERNGVSDACSEGLRRCESEAVERCVNGEWALDSPCSEEEICLERDDSVFCAELCAELGQKRCQSDSQQMLECKAWGDVFYWQDGKNCALENMDCVDTDDEEDENIGGKNAFCAKVCNDDDLKPEDMDARCFGSQRQVCTEYVNRGGMERAFWMEVEDCGANPCVALGLRITYCQKPCDEGMASYCGDGERVESYIAHNCIEGYWHEEPCEGLNCLLWEDQAVCAEEGCKLGEEDKCGRDKGLSDTVYTCKMREGKGYWVKRQNCYLHGMECFLMNIESEGPYRDDCAYPCEMNDDYDEVCVGNKRYQCTGYHRASFLSEIEDCGAHECVAMPEGVTFCRLPCDPEKDKDACYGETLRKACVDGYWFKEACGTCLIDDEGKAQCWGPNDEES